MSEELQQSSESNFHLAFLFLPKAKRKAMYDFYEFCRYADDVVDDVDPEPKQLDQALSSAQNALNRLRLDVKASFNGGHVQSSLGERVLNLVKEYPVKQKHLQAIIDGCEMDLSKSRYETFEELYTYCYRVASAVGLVTIEIFGYSHAQTQQYAIDLGIAFQLTNILRDLREDAQRNRIYLPQEDLKRFGYGEEDLFNGVDSSAFHALMAFQCQRVHTYYDRAKKQLPKEDRRSLMTAQVMRAIYYKILMQIEHDPSKVLKGRISFSKPQKLMYALLGYLSNRF